MNKQRIEFFSYSGEDILSFLLPVQNKQAALSCRLPF